MRTPDFGSWNRRRTGLVGILCVGLLGAFVIVLSGLHVGSRSYSAELANTGGIRPGEEVQVAGVGVGKVDSVALVGEHVEVRFTVDHDIRLGRDTTVQVKVATLLGTHFLKVDPAGAGELRDDTVPQAQTSVPYQLQDVINSGSKALSTYDSATIAKSMSQVADVLKTARPDLRPALVGVQRVSEAVAGRADQLGDLLEAADKVAGQLRSDTGNIVGLMKQATLILDELRARRTAIHDLLADTHTLAASLTGAIRDNEHDLDPLLADLDRTVSTLKAHQRTLVKAVDLLAPTVRYFTNASGTGPWVDQYTYSGTPDTLGCRMASGGCR